MSKVNENIGKFRKFRGIKQADLAKMVGKSKNSVSNWESNGNAPDLDTIEKICKALNVTPNQLFGWQPLPEYEAYAKEVYARKAKLAEYKAMYDKLNQELKDLEKKMEEV